MKLKQHLLLILLLFILTGCGSEKREQAKTIWNIVYTKFGLIYIVEAPKEIAKESIDSTRNLANKAKDKIKYGSDHGIDIFSRGLNIDLKDQEANSSYSDILILNFAPESPLAEIIDQKEFVYFRFDDASMSEILSNSDWESDHTRSGQPTELLTYWGADSFEADSIYFQDLKKTTCRCHKKLWIDSDLKEAVFEVIYY